MISGRMELRIQEREYRKAVRRLKRAETILRNAGAARAEIERLLDPYRQICRAIKEEISEFNHRQRKQ